MSWREEDRGHATVCWIWQGPLNDRRYGLTKSAYGRIAHRAVWVERNGPVPGDLELDHLCRVRSCVNPGHLELVTHQENCRRGAVARMRPDASELARRRVRAGLSQSQLAERLGVTQSLIHCWERGRASVPDEFDVTTLAWIGGGARPDPVAARRDGVRRLYPQGISTADIAAELGVPAQAVRDDVTLWR